MSRKDDLEKFADATRKVQGELGNMVMRALDLNGLRGKELPGAELVLRRMRGDLNLIMDSLFPPRVKPTPHEVASTSECDNMLKLHGHVPSCSAFKGGCCTCPPKKKKEKT